MTEEPTSPPATSAEEPSQPVPHRPGLAVRFGQARQGAQLAVLGVVAVYVVLFIAFNTRRTKIDFVFASTRLSLIFLILLSLGIGLVLGVLVSQLRRHRQRSR